MSETSLYPVGLHHAASDAAEIGNTLLKLPTAHIKSDGFHATGI